MLPCASGWAPLGRSKRAGPCFEAIRRAPEWKSVLWYLMLMPTPLQASPRRAPTSALMRDGPKLASQTHGPALTTRGVFIHHQAKQEASTLSTRGKEQPKEEPKEETKVR